LVLITALGQVKSVAIQAGARITLKFSHRVVTSVACTAHACKSEDDFSMKTMI